MNAIGDTALRDSGGAGLGTAGAPGLVQAIARRAASDAAAIEEDGRAVTFGALMRRVSRTARALRALGAGPEERVALDLPLSADLLVAALACLEAGTAYVPVDAAFPAARVQETVRESGARWLVTFDPARAGALAGDVQVLAPRDLAGIAAGRPARPLRTSAEPANVAYVIYTSGSTGRPKGVAITRRSLWNYLQWAERHYPTYGGGTALFVSPAVDLSVTSLFLPLLKGEPLIVYGGHDSFSALGDALADGRTFGFLKMTPSHLRLLMDRFGDAGPAAPPCRTLVLGGEHLDARIVGWWRRRWPGTRIFNEYGPTETTVGSTVHEVAPDEDGAAVPIGAAVANTAVHVAGRDLHPAPDGVEGELYIGGLGVARGYLGRPDLTAERFLPDPHGASPGGRLYRTGDRAIHTAAGLQCLGRLDRQVKIAGHRIEPSEIEDALRSVPGVADAVVLALDASGGARALASFVVPAAPGDERDALAFVERLRVELGTRLPAFMIPTRVSVVQAIPLTPGGKVDRDRLVRSSTGDAIGERRAQPPRTLVEETLAAIWSQALGVPEVGIDDNFFSLGGDSMRSLQVRYKAGQRGLRFELRDLFEARTIRRLAERVTGAGTTAAAETAIGPFDLLRPTDRALVPDDVEDAYPLSRLQMGTLYHSALAGRPGIYHNINSYRVRVAFDLEALSSAVRRLAARHPILRTSFNLSDYAEAVQLVHRTARIPLEMIDLRGWSGPRQQAALAEWLDVEARHAFDGDRPPLLRFFVHRFDDDELQFSVSKHHSILDGWSAASMVSELFNDYLFLLLGEGEPPGEPSARYRDFVALEREALSAPAAKTFWRGCLDDCSFLRLGRGTGLAPAPDFPSGSIATREVRVAPEVNARLVAIAAEIGVPLKDVLLAAHLKVLSLASGQRDVVTGLVSNGRPETAESERTLGLFLNSVPFRIALGRSECWDRLIQRVFDEERRLFPFRRYPMSEIKRDLGGGALFDTLFYFTNFHVFQQFDQHSHLRAIDFVGFEETEMRFTSAFNVHPLTRRLSLFLHFRVADFGVDQAAEMVRCYERVLEDVAAGPTRRHADVRPVSDEARVLQVHAWNGADEDAPADRPGDVVAEIERVMALRPDAVAVRCGDEALTYGTVARRSGRVAGWLRARGTGPDTLVGVAVSRTAGTVVALLGVLRSGAAYVALDAHAPAGRLRQIAEEAGVSCVLSGSSLVAATAAALSGRCEVVDVDAVSRTGPDGRGPIEPEALAYVLFTSGSTGRPKGVMVSHRGLAASTATRRDYYGEPPSRFLLLSPFFFDSAVAGLFWTLACAGCLVLPPEGDHREPSRLARACVSEGITHLLCIPSLYRGLLESLGASAGALQVAIVAGEACSASLVAAHAAAAGHVRLFNEYGPTEGTVWTTVSRLDANGGAHVAGDAPPIGRACGTLRVYLSDEKGELLPVGAQGEIVVGGSGVARGYWRQPAATAARFLPDGWTRQPGRRCYRTGDLGRWRGDGQLLFEGRRDDEVKIRGHRLSLGEVEALLREHPDVAAAAAAVRTKGAGAQLLGFVVLRAGASVSGDALRAHLRQRLPAAAVPAAVCARVTFPTLSNGKINRRQLVEEYEGDAGRPPRRRAPETPIEIAVAGAWAHVLGRQDLGADDDFVELGGDSIVALQVAARLRAAFPVEITVRDVFETRTIAALGARIEDLGRAGRLTDAASAVAAGADQE